MAKDQLELADWVPRERDRNYHRGGKSFYFFDLDNNIIHLDTSIILFSRRGEPEWEISPHELARFGQSKIGADGPLKDWYLDQDDVSGSFRNFRDHPRSLLQRLRRQPQSFVRDLRDALRRPEWEWKGPSWNHFRYATINRRWTSIITARGHQPSTIMEGLSELVRLGYLPRQPRYLSVYPVTNPEIRKQLGDVDKSLPAAALKRRAILHSVEEAFRRFGRNPHHRFGMSDDDPENLELITEAMLELKEKYPRNAFFVIDTSHHRIKKMEIVQGHVEERAAAEEQDASPDDLNYRLFDL